jgi:hypothetical protein
MSRRVIGAPNLLEDDFTFSEDFFLIEDRVANGVGENVEPLPPSLRGERCVIDGLIEGRIGINVAAESFDVPGNVSDASPFSAFEEHVFVEMGEPLFSGTFVRRADPRPNLKLDDRRAVALAHQ